MIQIKNAKKVYRVGEREILALRDVSLEVAKGEVFGIVGHSGAGKSTLIRLINRLERATSGEVWVDGQEVGGLEGESLREFRQRVGMIFQHFNLLGSKTIAENVAIPLRVAGSYSKQQIDRRIDELLELVGLGDQRNKYPAQLSGGQKQRVGIARALANNPTVLLCDEATSALDPQTTRSVLALIKRINEQLGLTIVLITHEMDVVRSICDRVAVLDDGVVVEQGEVIPVFLHPQHATTRRFVQEAEHVDEAQEQDSFASVSGRIVRLTFVGDPAYQPVLAELVRNHAIDFNILSGRIERIKDTPCGQLTLSLNGAPDVAEAALAFLQQAGVDIEVLR